MDISLFDYDLPESYIAQTPVYPRDSSKLLVYNTSKKTTEHRHFYDITDYLCPGDALVINDTKVMPARLTGAGEKTGAPVEVLLLERRDINTWEVLCKPGKRARINSVITFSPELSCTVTDVLDDGQRIVRFNCSGVFEEVLDRLGQMPLPPYIKEKLQDQGRYQTVYAREVGSAAAPTAGLHFTPELLKRIEDMGVQVIPLLLHVGLGTFRPVKESTIEAHKMHTEFYSVTEASADKINKVKANGGRIFAVGTTSVRTLETVTDENGVVHPGSGYTNIFIYPPYKFKCVDCIITNFHLPKSTLLMLVSSFCSREEILAIYETAKKENYRFFSFGDAMLLERPRIEKETH